MDTTPAPLGLPTSIDIGPFNYMVTTDELEHSRACNAMSLPYAYGSSSHKQLMITIDTAQARGQMSDTLLHEVIHAIASMTGLDCDWGKDEEIIIRRLTPAILDVLRRNPQLVGFLLELEES